MTELPVDAGDELGAGEWMEITQERIDAFSEATEDHQWIHKAGERADEGPFGGPIAQGFLTLSLVGTLTTDVMRPLMQNSAMVVNYGLDRVRFITPVPVGSRIRARARLADVKPFDGGHDVKSEVTIEIEGGSRPAAVAETLVRVYG